MIKGVTLVTQVASTAALERLGGLFAARGVELFGAFHVAAIACAIAALAAGAAAFLFVRKRVVPSLQSAQ